MSTPARVPSIAAATPAPALARPATGRSGPRRGRFIERTLRDLLEALELALEADRTTRRQGMLQALDARAKVVALLALVLSATLARTPAVPLLLLLAALALAALSRVPLRLVLGRAAAGALAFTALLALPALFLTPGVALLRVPLLGFTVTDAGARIALLLLARVAATACLGLLLVLTTRWPAVLRALRSLGVPAAAVVVLAMTHRYLFLLVATTRAMLEARQSRRVGRLRPGVERQMATATLAVLLGKTLELTDEVWAAMRSRGFRGEFPALAPGRMRARDWLAIALGTLVLAATAAGAVLPAALR